jgi:prepilin-type N-terminal cleavage/methylation domain-containing protein
MMPNMTSGRSHTKHGTRNPSPGARANCWVSRPKGSAAFTLIELLVVIAVIALLASMVIPITGAVNRAKIRARARAELAQIETGILNYKTKLGFYPPDNRTNAAVNQLYYELLGTTLDGSGLYTTLDGSSQIRANDVNSTFGVGGFMNTTRGAGSDEGQTATAFLKGIRPGQIGELAVGASTIRLLVGAVAWPLGSTFQPVPSPPAKKAGLNPWRYNSSNPTNNPGSYDLWMDIVIGGKTHRICNWTQKVLVVTQ